MGTQTAKQYLELQGKPILAYALEIFEQSAVVDDILLMTDKDHVEYCKKEICEKYGIKKSEKRSSGFPDDVTKSSKYGGITYGRIKNNKR